MFRLRSKKHVNELVLTILPISIVLWGQVILLVLTSWGL